MDSKVTNPPLLGVRLRNNKLSHGEPPEALSHELLGAEGLDLGLQELLERAVRWGLGTEVRHPVPGSPNIHSEDEEPDRPPLRSEDKKAQRQERHSGTVVECQGSTKDTMM